MQQVQKLTANKTANKISSRQSFRGAFAPQEGVPMTLYNRGFSYYAVYSLSKAEALREGRKQIWISLHTKDRGLAEQRYFVVMSELMKRLRFKDETMTTPFQIPDELLLPSLKETKAKLRQSGYGCVYPYDKHLIELLLVEHLQDKIRTEQNKAGVPMIADIYQNRFNEAHGYYYNGDFSLIDDECNAYFEQENLPRPTDSVKNIVREVFMRAQLQFLDYMVKYLNGEKPVLPTQIIPGIPASKTNSSIYAQSGYNAPVKEEIIQKATQGKTFLDIATQYCNLPARKNKTDANKKILGRAKVVQELLGVGRDMRSITSDDLQNAANNLAYIPYSYGHDHNKKSIFEHIKIGKRKPENCITQKTLDEYVGCIKTVFAEALRKGDIQENIVDAVDWPVSHNQTQTKKYAPFSIEQLNAIFHAPLYTGCKDDGRNYNKVGTNHPRRIRFWLPLIALFTGARINEICQLHTDDVQEKNGIPFISINEEDEKHVKTKAGIRQVPIHNELIKIGFLDYAAQMREKGEKLLFPEVMESLVKGKRAKDASPSAPLSKWFNHFIESVNTCIEQPELKFTLEHVFHSFRHTVRTEFRRNRAPEDDVCRICGWEDGSKGKTLADHYGESVLENLQETVNSGLKYDGVDLSHLYV